MFLSFLEAHKTFWGLGRLGAVLVRSSQTSKCSSNGLSSKTNQQGKGDMDVPPAEWHPRTFAALDTPGMPRNPPPRYTKCMTSIVNFGCA